MIDVIGPMAALLGMFAMIGFIVWVVMTSRRRSETVRAQTEMQTKLLEKFGSSQEMLQFLQSDAGKRFLESATIEQTKPYGRILGSASVGIILFMFGLAFVVLRGQVHGSEEAFVIPGVLFLALGLGFLLSAAVAYALSKSWGLINSNSKPHGADQAQR